MTVRIEIPFEDIRVGDVVDAVREQPIYEAEYVAYHGTVMHTAHNYLETQAYYLQSEVYTFYLIERPEVVVPEPAGLGAVVELHNENGEPWRIVKIYNYDGDLMWIDSEGDVMSWENWMEFTMMGHVVVLSEGYVG